MGKKPSQTNTRHLSAHVDSPVIMILLLLIPIIVLYARILSFGFTGLDDEELVVNKYSFNQHLTNIPEAFRRDAFSDTKGDSFYRPVSTISFIIDAVIGGDAPWMYHLSNLLLYALAIALLFIFLQRLNIPKTTAFFLLLLMSVHPIFTHAVCWIPARMDLLMAVFGLISLISFISLVETNEIQYGFINILFFGLSVFSKETAVVLPVCYLAIYHLKHRVRINFGIYGAAWILLFAIYWYMRSQVIRHEAVTVSQSLSAILQNLPVLPIMVSKIFLPFRFSPMPQFELFFTIAGLIVLSLCVYSIIRSSGHSRYIQLFGLAWYILFSLPPLIFKHPASQFGYTYLEHRALFPVFGLLIFFAQLLQNYHPGTTLSKWKFVIAGFGLFVFGIAFINSGNYQSPLKFLSKAIELNPSCAFAMNTRGTYFDKLGDRLSAERDFNMAISVAPGYADPWYNKGLLYMENSKFDSAIVHFSKAIQLDSNYSDAYLNRAVAKVGLHDPDGAIQDYKNSLRIESKDETVFYNLANLYADKGMFNDAIMYYTKSIALNPANPESYNNRANVKCLMKQYMSAAADCDSALALRSNYPEAYFNKATALFMLDDTNNALALANQAIAIAPNFADPYLLKIQILKKLGRTTEADELSMQISHTP